MFSHDLIARYGPLILFINIFGSSLGLPIPALPTLIAIGASISIVTHTSTSTLLHFATMLGAAVLGGVLGDFVWFQGGKRYGERTLNTVCKLSLSRETCVRKTERFFGRWGVRVLIVSRFVPGLSLVSVPLCGAMAVTFRSFVAYDSLGVGLWASIWLAVGAFFAVQITLVMYFLAHLGWEALLVLAMGLALFILYRYWRRIVLSRALESARISATELHALIASDQPHAIFDIRSPERRSLDPFVIPRAVFTDEQNTQDIVKEYGVHRTLVIYCSCPAEVSAAWMAKRLRRAGVEAALPLTGGIDAWRTAGFDVEPLKEVHDVAEHPLDDSALIPSIPSPISL